MLKIGSLPWLFVTCHPWMQAQDSSPLFIFDSQNILVDENGAITGIFDGDLAQTLRTSSSSPANASTHSKMQVVGDRQGCCTVKDKGANLATVRTFQGRRDALLLDLGGCFGS